MRHDFDQQFKERLLFMSTSPRILTIMGSGETAPTMMKHHRELIARMPGTPKAVVLDTPYGFQENAAELASKAVEYFRKSVGHPIEIAGLTRIHGQDTLTVEQGLARVRQADYVFAGPGSPTYALRQWAGAAGVQPGGHELAGRGGCFVFRRDQERNLLLRGGDLLRCGARP